MGSSFHSNTSDSSASGHQPVLINEVLALLDPRPGHVVLDCTLGRGGHAAAIIPRLAPGGRYIGLDIDPANIEFCKARFGDAPVEVDVVGANFTHARRVLDDLGVDKVDLLLADLGFSSTQMDDPTRGLSFQVEGPLDMRLDPSLQQTAADLVNTLPEKELADLIFQYGEERLSRRIARKIVERRRDSPIEYSTELADLIRQAYPHPRRHGGGGKARSASRRGPRIDPATRTFMALRIAVNRELEALETLLAALPSLVRSRAADTPGASHDSATVGVTGGGGVAAIISFHSLEDRMVKQAFNGWHRQGRVDRLTKKPMVADEVERHNNPRSRSAKLRAVKFIA